MAEVLGFVVYAVLVWYAAARWRRRWPSLLAILSGLSGLIFVGWIHYRLHIWSNGQIYLPVLQVLLYPYAVLVAIVGLYICLLPRRPVPWPHCPGCEYDLRGLDLPIESCPECGMTEELARFIGGREFKGFPAMPPPEPPIIPAARARPRPAPAPAPAAPRSHPNAIVIVWLDPVTG